MSLLNAYTRSIGFSNGWSRQVLHSAETSSLPVFEARVMNKAISESGGEATDSTNLGSVSHSYDDAKNNDFKVTLPYG